MHLRKALERVMTERGLSWAALARLAGLAPKSLYIVRDGNEDGLTWGTVRALPPALGLSFSEFFADAPTGARGRLAAALSALPEEDLDAILGILDRLAVSRPAKERAQLQAVAEAFQSRKGNST